MNSSAKQILIGWIYRRIGFLKRGMKKQIKPLAAILRFLDFSIPPIPSFRVQREIFLALRAFLFPSQKVSPFPLSHIGRYTSVPKRSLHFGRDDVTGIALSKHIHCTLREINPFPPPSFRAQQEIFLALHFFLLPFAKGSPFSALSCSLHRSIPVFCYHTYDIIPSCKKDPSTSLGMTLREYRSLTLPIYFPCNNDTREAPSTFAALLFFMRRTTPLNPTT